MKRLVASLVISFCLLLAYGIACVLFLGFVYDSQRLGAYIAIPLRWPVIVYDYFFTITGNEGALFVVVVFVIDIATFAVPIYTLLTLFARRKPSDLGISAPPPPPTFDE